LKNKLDKKDKFIIISFVVLSAVLIGYDQFILKPSSDHYKSVPFTADEIDKLANTDSKTVVIYPILTQYAYHKNGFYDYYKGICSTCTTISMRPYGINATFNTGINGFQRLVQLHYEFITDLTVDRHPEILNDYDTVILLHNEYVTQKEFDAITSHKNVIYLYPNSLYAKVSVDYDKWTMTLIRGHEYDNSKTPPYPQMVDNGFGFVTNTRNEYDINCYNYKWLTMPNGMELSCFPDLLVTYDRNIFNTIRDYPDLQPVILPQNSTQYNLTAVKIPGSQ